MFIAVDFTGNGEVGWSWSSSFNLLLTLTLRNEDSEHLGTVTSLETFVFLVP